MGVYLVLWLKHRAISILSAEDQFHNITFIVNNFRKLHHNYEKNDPDF